MDTALANALLAMEVTSDTKDIETVYGIATNSMEWIFLKQSDGKVGIERYYITYTCVHALIPTSLRA
jgi:hypothetical protein